MDNQQFETLWNAVFNYGQIFFHREMQGLQQEIRNSGRDPNKVHPGEFYGVYLSNILYLSDTFAKKAEEIAKKEDFESFWKYIEGRLLNVFTSQLNSQQVPAAKTAPAESDENQKKMLIDHLGNTIHCVIQYHRELGKFKFANKT